MHFKGGYLDFSHLTELKIISVLSISESRHILHPDFEKKLQHFKSRMFFLRPYFDKNVQEFPTGHFFFFPKKQCTKGLTCVDNFDTNLTKILFKGSKSDIRVKGVLI